MPNSPNARLFYRAAKQRFEDALFLFELKRTTAAVYLAGYSVECILKSLVLTTVSRGQEDQILALFRGGRAHDYEWLINLYRGNGGAGIQRYLVAHFARVNTWSTDMRYSPGTVEANRAKAFLDSVAEIMQWADERL